MMFVYYVFKKKIKCEFTEDPQPSFSQKRNHCLYLYTHQAEFEQRSAGAVFLDGESLNSGFRVKQNGVRLE